MFEVGQKVWDVVVGEGVVILIRKDFTHPVVVAFNDGGDRTYTTDGKSIRTNESPSLYPYPVEIVKKVVKPSINWEHVRGEYKFLAQDANGNAYLYRKDPVLGSGFWLAKKGECSEANSYASYTPGTCDWKDSLVARPKDA